MLGAFSEGQLSSIIACVWPQIHVHEAPDAISLSRWLKGRSWPQAVRMIWCLTSCFKLR